MPEHWLILTISLILTYLYGSVFTVLFLNIELNNTKNALPFGVFSLVNIIIQLGIGYFFSPSLLVTVYPLVVHLPLLLLCTFYYKKDFLTSLSSLMMCYFLTAPRYIFSEIIILLLPKLPCPDHFGKIIASLLLVFPIYRWVYPILKRGFSRPKKDILHFFVPLLMVYSLSYLLYVYTELLVTNRILIMEIIFTLFFVIILYYIKKYFISIDDIIEKENRNHILELSHAAVQKQLSALTDSNEQTRILRHNIRHYASLIDQYAHMGDLEKIIEIAEQLSGKTDTATVKNYCANQSVNLLLSNYFSQLSNIDANVSYQVSVPAETFVYDLDLCILLGNALDNAVQSISKCRHNKFLTLILRCNDEKLFMELKNSCETAVSFQEDLPLSTKSGHGYGSKSIRYISEKYHGLSSFELSNDIFITQVILHR